MCYCKDCQAFAHFLGNSGAVLDAMGGTDVVATLQKNVTFSGGLNSLACMSLSSGGMLRWYASCCNTPIGNTPRNFKVSHVGLVHTCLKDVKHAAESLDASFGPVRMRVNTGSANAKGKGKPKAMPISTITSVVRFLASLVRARLDGSYRRTPFFDRKRGTPIVAPRVLTRSERERVTNGFPLGPIEADVNAA